MNSFARLTVSDVARHYGRRKALSQISFTCDACEIVGLNDKCMQGRLIFFVPDEGVVLGQGWGRERMR